MRIFRISIRGAKYPLDYDVQASNWAPAISRAIKQWQKRGKRERCEKLTIVAIRSGELLKATNGED